MEKAVKRYAPIFVLPTFLAFVIGFILPFIEGLYLSFCQFTKGRKVYRNRQLSADLYGQYIYKFF